MNVDGRRVRASSKPVGTGMFDERFEDWMTEGHYRDWALNTPSHTVAQLKAAFARDMLDDAISAAEAQTEW